MRVLLADDHDLVRDAIAAMLQASGCETVVTASDYDQAVALIAREERFDLVILDYDMPGMNGLDGLKKLIAAAPELSIAILSGTVSAQVARDALATGAIGFVPKTLPAKSIGSAVALMASGSVFAPVELMNAAKQGPVPEDLSPREAEVLRGICDGKTNKEIARDLGVQEVTIKLHVRTLTRKIGARNRTHAAMIARERNWR